MSEVSAALHLFGMIETPAGLIMIGFGIWAARHPRFSSWLGVTMQYLGVGLILAGPIAYFQPWGVDMSQHAVALILMIPLVLTAIRFRRARNATAGNSPQ